MGLTSAERQRRYIQRLKDRAAAPPPATVSDDGELRRLRDQMEYLKSNRDGWQERAMKAEDELRLEQRRHLNTTKDKIVLKQEIAALTAKPRRTPTKV
jgi:hypothetical protein